MIRSLYTGASGVKNHQNKMDVVGNNISNVNTVGYKSSRTTFADILSQNIKGASAANDGIGSTNPTQIGLGTNVSSIDLIFKDGAPVLTNKNTDLCLSGDGLFVVRRGNDTYYTRDGAFEFDAVGNYVLPGSGHFVQGWMANNGVINTSGAVSDIKIGNSLPGKPTTDISFQYNLSSDTALVTVDKVTKTEKVYEDVNTRILEPGESNYNLNVRIGDNDYILHVVQDNDIDLDKNWKVKTVNGTTVTLEDDNGNAATIDVILKGANNIKEGDAFSADTSSLRFKSTVNQAYPLEFSVGGIPYKAVKMNHSVEIPGEGWQVTSVSNDGNATEIVIEQYQNGVHDGCTVWVTLDKKLPDSQLPAVGGLLEFAGDVMSKPFKRERIIETEEDGVTITGNTSSVPTKTTVNIYDSLGKNHQVPVYFFHEGEVNNGSVQSTNKWLVSLENNGAVKNGDVTSYEFVDADGKKSTISMPVVELEFDDAGNLISGNTATLTMGNQNVNVDFTKVTQQQSKTTVTSTSNGEAGGTLKDVQIDSSGIITGFYTNGTRRMEAQVAVAHFNNSGGLVKSGTSMYKESANSGTPVIIKAGEFGVSITPGALEMSNVDVANEFAEMIITQRGFQSNAKSITVGDEMIETAINMKK